MTADVTRLADESRSSIAAVCRALEVPRSSVYARRSRPVSARARDTAALDVDIAAVHAQSERATAARAFIASCNDEGALSAASA